MVAMASKGLSGRKEKCDLGCIRGGALGKVWSHEW